MAICEEMLILLVARPGFRELGGGGGGGNGIEATSYVFGLKWPVGIFLKRPINDNYKNNNKSNSYTNFFYLNFLFAYLFIYTLSTFFSFHSQYASFCLTLMVSTVVYSERQTRAYG